jgi:hypothetical protein
MFSTSIMPSESANAPASGLGDLSAPQQDFQNNSGLPKDLKADPRYSKFKRSAFAEYELVHAIKVKLRLR